jgi:acetyltransferase-like isoleucine patch superfamily enzyme
LVTGPPFIQAKEEPNIHHSAGSIMATGSSTPPSHNHATFDNSSTATPAPQNILPYRPEASTPTSAAPVDPSAPSGVGFSHVTIPPAGSASSGRRSEKEKMMNSQLYMASDPELTADREICKAACFRFNNIAANPMNAISPAEKGRMLHDILRPGQNWTAVPSPTVAGQPMFTYTSDNGFNSDLMDIQVDAPFHCSYGYNIRMGKSVLIEFGCTILDSCVVTIKARTILSPGCKIYSATHPIDPRKRNGARGPECAKPVTIEEDCWLGGGVTVLGGITIGKGSVVGAGSVVTRVSFILSVEGSKSSKGSEMNNG